VDVPLLGPHVSYIDPRIFEIRVIALAFLLCLWWPAPSHAGEEIPFITTPDNVTLAMLRLARVGPRDHVIDLGSGDGRIVITAARRFGASGLGVEIVPELVRRSRENARSAGVQQRVEFREQDLFKTDLSKATVVTLYLLPEVNLQLRPALLALKPGTRVVSHDWDMGDWKPELTITVAAPDKTIGREKLAHLHLWVVPARIEGHWCAIGRPRGGRLQLTQSFQRWHGSFARGGATQDFGGVIEGPALRSTGGGSGALRLRLRGEQLHVTQASGALSLLQGARFTRSSAATCATD
jgi:SAM-dependent methyltransferase